MKRFFVFPLLSCVFIVGCASNPPKKMAPQPSYGYTGEDSTLVEQSTSYEVAPVSPETAPAAPQVQVKPAPAPAAAPAPAVKVSVGKPVPGKPGFVTSPYAEGAGLVDVRGYPPGTEVKDPYTGKIFLVP